MKLIGKTHTPSMATSNRSEVHRTGTSPFMKALKGISNSLQKLAEVFGQKSHSLQPINKIEIDAVRSQNTPNSTSKKVIPRPKVPPPAPPSRVPDSTIVSSKVESKPPRPEPPPPRVSDSTIASSKVESKPSKPEPPPSLNSNRAASSVTVAPPLKPVRPAPPPPEKTNVSQQQPEISTQNGSEPVKPDASINEIKMSQQQMYIAASLIEIFSKK